MLHLEKSVFLLLIFVGGLFYIALTSRVQKANFLKFTLKSAIPIMIFIISLLIFFSIISELGYDLVKNPVLQHLNNPFYVKFLIGIICGMLLIDTMRSSKASSSALFIGLRAIPFIFFFIIGFFSYELQQSFRYITKIQAAGITLDLGQTNDNPQELLSSNGESDDKTLNTPFELGLSLMEEAFDRLDKDIETFALMCNRHPATLCSNSTSEELQNALDENNEYFKLLSKLKVCLVENYAKYFPNGLPIQDELSDFATSYAVDFNPEYAEEFKSSLLKLKMNLVRFATYAEKYKDKASACSATELNDELVERIVGSRIQVESPNYSLPHKSILEASIIASSGYPEEAAAHLQREYNLFTTEDVRKKFVIEKGNFHDFVLQLRMLSPLELLLSYNKRYELQLKFTQLAISRVEEQFRKIGPFLSDKPSKFVEYCSQGKMVLLNDILPSMILGEPPEDKEKIRSKIDLYFRSYIRFYLQTYTRLLSAAAFNPNSLKEGENFDILIRVSYDLEDLTSSNSASLEGCLTPALVASGIEPRELRSTLDVLRHDILASHGFMLARQADIREVDPAIAPDIDRSIKAQALCTARSTLLRAWRLGKSQHNGKPLISEESETRRKILKILEQINAANPICTT